jgi:RNA polymerase sigma factor (sigma-70 family)
MVSAVVLRSQPDGKLVALAADGSEAAFEAIVLRYRRPIDAYCRRLLLSDSRSEDVVQQVFVNAWAALRTGTEVRALKAWLYRIAHHQAIGTFRLPEYDFDGLSEALFGADAPEADLERRLLMRETLAAVAALPELQREAILRTAVDGHSYEQVAAALGLSDHAVRGLVYRARSALRAAVAAAAPPPLIIWAAGQARRPGGLSPRLGELLAGGGSAGGAAVVLKSAAVLATSAAVLGGTVSGTRHAQRATPRAHRAAASIETPAPPADRDRPASVASPRAGEATASLALAPRARSATAARRSRSGELARAPSPPARDDSRATGGPVETGAPIAAAPAAGTGAGLASGWAPGPQRGSAASGTQPSAAAVASPPTALAGSGPMTVAAATPDHPSGDGGAPRATSNGTAPTPSGDHRGGSPSPAASTTLEARVQS